ncbi:MAG: CDP-glycerol glycerophosphotransferase family protein [Elusimicrobiota bacterium]|jgi:hypothetical protein|nr:CDP-glycerol glycerophosphotransferase family protein [Elusimicrobiota bacterium]
MNVLKLAAAIIIFLPVYAYAYLDPGTGNALAAALFGLIGSVLFFSKNLYYKVKAKITGKEIKTNAANNLAFFSEGRRYWIFYKDIIDELIKRKVGFTYYTMDMDDPAFEIMDLGDSNADLDAFDIQYVGKGNKGYAAISALKEPYLVTTTPNIGTPGYPIKKPKNCKNLIHIFHSISSVSIYHKHSLDSFDTAILSGKEFERDIRALEKKRNLPPKKLLIGGLPYMDNLIAKASRLDIKTDGKTVLIASTWDKRGCLKTYGADFIKQIAQAGYNVIVRPHPYSYVFEPDFIDKLAGQLKDFTNIKFDDEIDNLKSLARADVLVSDVSAVRFDFLFAFDRPIISLETGYENYDQYEYADLGYCWDVEIGKDLGAYVKKDEIGNIVEKIKGCINNKASIDKDSIVTNIGLSAEIIARQITDIST